MLMDFYSLLYLNFLGGDNGKSSYSAFLCVLCWITSDPLWPLELKKLFWIQMHTAYRKGAILVRIRRSRQDFFSSFKDVN